MKYKKEDRIEPTVIPELFRELGITPVAGSWAGLGQPDCGCLLVAVGADATKIKDSYHSPSDVIAAAVRWDQKGIRNGNAAAKFASLTGLHRDYCLGMIYGWDNHELTTFHPTHTEEYRRLFSDGWHDGRAAATACGLDVPFVPRDAPPSAG